MIRSRARVARDDRGASVVFVMIFLLVFSVVALAALDRTQVSFEASAVARDIRSQEYAADAAVDFAVHEVMHNPTTYIGKPCNIEVRGINGVPSTTVACSLTATAGETFGSHTPTTSAYEPSKGQKLVINKPAGTKAGDVLIAQIAYELGPQKITITPPNASWILEANDGDGTFKSNGTVNQSSNIGQAIFIKKAVVSDASAAVENYAWSFKEGSSLKEVKFVGGIIRYTAAKGRFNADRSYARGTGGDISVHGIAANPTDHVLMFFTVFKDTDIPAPKIASETATELMNPGSKEGISIFAGSSARKNSGNTGTIDTTPALRDKWIARVVSLSSDLVGGGGSLANTSGVFTAKIGSAERVRTEVLFPTGTTGDITQWSVLKD